MLTDHFPLLGDEWELDLTVFHAGEVAGQRTLRATDLASPCWRAARTVRR